MLRRGLSKQGLFLVLFISGFGLRRSRDTFGWFCFFGGFHLFGLFYSFSWLCPFGCFCFLARFSIFLVLSCSPVIEPLMYDVLRHTQFIRQCHTIIVIRIAVDGEELMSECQDLFRCKFVSLTSSFPSCSWFNLALVPCRSWPGCCWCRRGHCH